MSVIHVFTPMCIAYAARYVQPSTHAAQSGWPAETYSRKMFAE